MCAEINILITLYANFRKITLIDKNILLKFSQCETKFELPDGIYHCYCIKVVSVVYLGFAQAPGPVNIKMRDPATEL